MASDFNRLLSTLKGLVKTSGMTYAELSKKLGVSEPTVKRILSGKSKIKLDTLEEICKILKVDFFELAKMARFGPSTESIPFLSPEQEEALGSDEELFTLFYAFTLGYTIPKILKEFVWTENKLEGFLLKLDRLKVIEYSTNKKVKMLVFRKARWSYEGPLLKKYMMTMLEDFCSKVYGEKRGNRYFFNYPLSDQSRELVEEKIRDLAREIERLSEIEIMSLPEENINFTSILLASKPWMPGFIEKYKK